MCILGACIRAVFASLRAGHEICIIGNYARLKLFLLEHLILSLSIVELSNIFSKQSLAMRERKSMVF